MSQSRRRAILRLVLGQCQVIGATVTLILLIREGVTPAVLGVATITGLLTITSVFLVRVLWRRDTQGKKRE